MQGDDEGEVVVREEEESVRLRVVFPMALGVFLTGGLAAWVADGAGPLSLAPYIPSPAVDEVGRLGSALRDMSPLGGAALWGAVSALLFLVFEGILRKTWNHAHEVAALVPAALFSVVPAQLAFQRVLGGEAVLAGLGVFLLGAWLALNRGGLSMRSGCVIAGLSAALHPAMLVIAPSVVGCAWLGGGIRSIPRAFAVAAIVMVTAGVASVGAIPAAPISEMVASERSGWALELLASSPVLAFWTQPRDLLPTGYLAMQGNAWPVWSGLALWALLTGWAMLTTGITRAAVVVGFAALAGAAPFVTPGWVPGDRGIALLPFVFALLLAGHLLSVVRGAVPRNVGILLALSIAVVGNVFPHTLGSVRDERFASRQQILMPRAQGMGFSAVAEQDPARLILFGLDVLAEEKRRRAAREAVGSFPSYRMSVSDVARNRLAVPGAPVLDAARLIGLTSRLRESTDSSGTIEEAQALERLDGLDKRLGALIMAGRAKSKEDWYPELQVGLQELMGDAMEIGYGIAEGRLQSRRFHMFVGRFNGLCRQAAQYATELGDLQYSVLLREILAEFSKPGRPPINEVERQGQLQHWRARALLGVELVEMKRYEEAGPHLAEALKRLPQKDLITAVARAAQGRVMLVSGADPIDVLDVLGKAWDGIATMGRQGDGLPGISGPSSRDYWLIAEFLLLRYELAKQHDAGLERQALHDAKLALEGPGTDARIRRVPALAFWARLRLLQGDRSAARRLLLEMRALKPQRLGERGSGSAGLLDVPRFRLAGLRTLLETLDPEADADLAAVVKGEISALDRF